MASNFRVPKFSESQLSEISNPLLSKTKQESKQLSFIVTQVIWNFFEIYTIILQI